MNSSHKHMCTLRNLGNQPGKTPMWGNPTRDILFSFRRLNISSRNTISSKRKPLTGTQNHPHNLLSWKTCQISCTTCTAQLNNTLEIVPHQNCTVCTRNRPNHQQKIPEKCLDLHATMLPRNPHPPLCCILYGSVQYGLFISCKLQHFLTANCLGICAHFLLGKAPSLLP
jgi:hypothetical protein